MCRIKPLKGGGLEVCLGLGHLGLPPGEESPSKLDFAVQDIQPVCLGVSGLVAYGWHPFRWVDAHAVPVIKYFYVTLGHSYHP